MLRVLFPLQKQESASLEIMQSCAILDSRIGFGTGGHPDDSNTCENEAKSESDNGAKSITATGFILVH